jgi:predicted secreted protein
MRRLALVPAAALAALAVTAVPASAKQVKLSIADTGKTVMVSKGDTIAITLPSNQTTPYHWVIVGKPSTKVAKVTRNQYVGSGSGVPGAPGHQYYTIAAKGTGKTNFTAQYQEISTGEEGTGKSAFSIAIKVR